MYVCNQPCMQECYIALPHIVSLCRAVADEQRSLALGVQSVFFRILGAIPGPIAFGAAIDSGCIYWQYECNRRGNCWVYENSLLGVRALAISISGLVLNVLFCILCWIFYPPMNCKSNTQDKKENIDDDAKETSSDSDIEIKVFIDNDDSKKNNGLSL